MAVATLLSVIKRSPPYKNVLCLCEIGLPFLPLPSLSVRFFLGVPHLTNGSHRVHKWLCLNISVRSCADSFGIILEVLKLGVELFFFSVEVLKDVVDLAAISAHASMSTSLLL